MQNDPLYNRIMEQMPDTEAIESEITTLSGKVTALEGKQAKIFTFHVLNDGDDMTCAEFSQITPTEFIALDPDIINITHENIGLQKEWIKFFDGQPTFINSNNSFIIMYSFDGTGFMIQGNTSTDTWSITEYD